MNFHEKILHESDKMLSKGLLRNINTQHQYCVHSYTVYARMKFVKRSSDVLPFAVTISFLFRA